MKKPVKTRCVMMAGPDAQMDQLGDSSTPANPLPIKCRHCTFPNLDFVAKPYLLAKGISSPAETSPARLGNFLVRERVRRILELTVPGACTFHPTADRKSGKAAPWWLAVPTRMLATPVPKAKPPLCPKCHEPKVWSYAMLEVWAKMNRFDSGGVDIFKSAAWDAEGTVEDDFAETNEFRKEEGLRPLPWSYWHVEPPAHPERWTRIGFDRELYFSARLEQLLRRAQVKGQIVRLVHFKDVQLMLQDETWVEDKLLLLAQHGLAAVPKRTISKTSPAQQWFKRFLQRSAGKGIKKADIRAVEAKQNLALPQDYKDFISVVGPKSFQDVCDMDGSTTTVLPPQKLDFKDHRRGKVPNLEGEHANVDGVMFASTDYGDCFVFDVLAKGNGYPVYWYRHEENTMELYAPNFAECIKRFVEKN